MELTLSENQKKELTPLGIVALYVFGSRAQAVAGPLSDYDFAALMKDEGQRSGEPRRHLRGGELYNKLYDILSPLCPRTLKNDIIDIVFLRDVPLELRFHVIRYGKILFETDPRTRVRFEENTTLEYCDYRPILDMFDRTILASI